MNKKRFIKVLLLSWSILIILFILNAILGQPRIELQSNIDIGIFGVKFTGIGSPLSNLLRDRGNGFYLFEIPRYADYIIGVYWPVFIVELILFPVIGLTCTSYKVKFFFIERIAEHKIDKLFKAALIREGHINKYGKPERRLGDCHLYWQIKKDYLKTYYGIDWKTPAEEHPNIEFD